MKIIGKLAFLLILLLTFVACDKDDEPLSDSASKLIGSWVFVERIDSSFVLYVFERVPSLIDEKIGYTFNSPNKIIERSPASEYGTHPVVYDDYKGGWSEKDSIIYFNVRYRNGKASHEWRLISVDDRYLKVSPIWYL